MSTLKPYTSIERIRLDAEIGLAEFLRESNMITESEYRAHYMGENYTLLAENASRGNSPAYFYNKVHFTDFKNVWNNVRDYPTVEDVYHVLHPSVGQVAKSTPSTTIARMLSKFLGKDGDPGVPGAAAELQATSTKERNELEKKERARQAQGIEVDADDYDINYSIDGGHRRRSSRTANVEKATELFPGELYNDKTRIPKRRWGVWWKRFFQKQTSVQNSTSGILAISRWTKHFIMGYQATDKIFFEIWYNTYDSTFSVHDKWGNPARRGEDIPLIRDALNILFYNIAQRSPDDHQVVRFQAPDLRRVNQDIARTLQGEITALQSTADRMKQRKQAITDAKQKNEEQEKRAEQARKNSAAAIRGGVERQAEDETDDRNNAVQAQLKKDGRDFARTMARLGVRVKEAISQLRAYMYDDEKISTSFADEVESEVEKVKILQAARSRKEAMEDLEATLSNLGRSPKDDEAAEEAIQTVEELEDDVFASLEREIYDKRGIAPDDVEGELKAIRSQRRRQKNFNAEPFSQKQIDAEKRKIAKQVEKNKRKQPSKHDPVDDPSLVDDAPQMDEEERKKAEKAKKETGHNKKGKGNVNESTAVGSTKTSSIARMGGKKKKDKKDEKTNENLSSEAAAIDLDDYEQNPLYHVAANARVDQIRRQAETSPYTRQMLNSEFLDGFVRPYTKTRMRDTRSLLRRIIERVSVFRGRPDRIIVPQRIVGLGSQAKGFFSGATARSDFIIGYTLNEVANFEIWYIQEISDNGERQVANFYLYDATAMRIIDSSIPHYRNAVQLMMKKIGSEAGAD